MTLRLQSTRIDLEDSWEAANDYFYGQGMTDGLPIVPPTPERVARMLSGARRAPSDVVGKVAPEYGEVTVEKIAVNAVMAGCMPEYLPVLIAAVEAVCEPDFNLHGVQTCTGAVGPMLIVNGPIRHRLKLNCGAGALGPGTRANATIGRAMRLILLNVGGAIPGEVDKSTMGWPGKYGSCFGENEELSPWEPLHVERGFRPEQSTVTVLGAEGTRQICDISPWPEQVAHTVAHGMIQTHIGMTSPGEGSEISPGPVLLLNPVFAGMFSRLGYTKASFKQYLWETARYPVEWTPPAARGWVKSIDGKVPLTESAAKFVIVVTGSDSGYHSTATGALQGLAITKPIDDQG